MLPTLGQILALGWRHRLRFFNLGGAGWGGVAVAGLRRRWRGGAGCVCLAFCALLRLCGRCPCCAGRVFGVLPVVQDRGSGPDSAARGVLQLQFLDQVVTCPLLYNDRCLGYDSTENCGISAVAVLTRWSMSLFMQFIDAYGRRCDHAATWCSSTSLSWCRGKFPWS